MFKDRFAHEAANGTASGTAYSAYRQAGGAQWSVATRGALAWDSLVTLAREIATAVKRWHIYRKAAAELNRMENHELEEIGVHRSEIEAVAYAIAEQQVTARPSLL